MLQDTLILLSNLEFDFQPVISFYPEEKLSILKDIINQFQPTISKMFLNRIQYFAQKGHSNGERFASAFNSAFSFNRNSSVIIIGADSPHISANILIEAINDLSTSPKSAIIGPSQTGGFYIFGLNNNINNLSSLFDTDHECNNLKNICSKESISVKIYPYLFDIDELEDIKLLHDLFKSNESIVHYTNNNFTSNLKYNFPRQTIKFLKDKGYFFNY